MIGVIGILEKKFLWNPLQHSFIIVLQVNMKILHTYHTLIHTEYVIRMPCVCNVNYMLFICQFICYAQVLKVRSLLCSTTDSCTLSSIETRLVYRGAGLPHQCILLKYYNNSVLKNILLLLCLLLQSKQKMFTIRVLCR